MRLKCDRDKLPESNGSRVRKHTRIMNVHISLPQGICRRVQLRFTLLCVEEHDAANCCCPHWRENETFACVFLRLGFQELCYHWQTTKFRSATNWTIHVVQCVVSRPMSLQNDDDYRSPKLLVFCYSKIRLSL